MDLFVDDTELLKRAFHRYMEEAEEEDNEDYLIDRAVEKTKKIFREWDARIEREIEEAIESGSEYASDGDLSPIVEKIYVKAADGVDIYDEFEKDWIVKQPMYSLVIWNFHRDDDAYFKDDPLVQWFIGSGTIDYKKAEKQLGTKVDSVLNEFQRISETLKQFVKDNKAIIQENTKNILKGGGPDDVIGRIIDRFEEHPVLFIVAGQVIEQRKSFADKILN